MATISTGISPYSNLHIFGYQNRITRMDIADYATLFKALSEPVRLRVLHLLLDKGELCVCDIVDTLGLSQSVVSRHLAYLRNAGLLSTRREGVWIYYQVTPVTSFADRLLALFHKDGSNSAMIKNDTDNFQGIAHRSCS
tara:strand:+ start:2551 stop:2967 length:417 start_codon:yes stop_codon:yes gene_type:complete